MRRRHEFTPSWLAPQPYFCPSKRIRGIWSCGLTPARIHMGEVVQDFKHQPPPCQIFVMHEVVMVTFCICMLFTWYEAFCIHSSFWILMSHTCTKCAQTSAHLYVHTDVSLLCTDTCTPHIHAQTLWVPGLWQPVISFNPFIMFLFSFPLFGGKKVNANRNSGTLKKNTQPQAEKTRAGSFWEEGHLCMNMCMAVWQKMSVCLGHVIVLHARLCEHGVRWLCCLLHMLTGKQRSLSGLASGNQLWCIVQICSSTTVCVLSFCQRSGLGNCLLVVPPVLQQAFPVMEHWIFHCFFLFV